jgi:predicted metal-dependent hydrolase
MQTTIPVTAPRPKPVVRRMGFAFDTSIPRHWFADNAVATHLVNGINLLFPAGERFFVRSVKKYADRIDDPLLAEQVRAFYGQEGRHAHEHERFFRILEAQGYDIERFLQMYERVCYGWLEKVLPDAMNLAGTAASEHFTATLADLALRERFLDHAHPVMRELLMWHAAEEIEHKAVAFDVLARVQPSRALRLAGLAMSSIMLSGFWALATLMLIRQDGRSWRELREDLARMRNGKPGLLRSVFLGGIREYARPDFHPCQKDNFALARDYLASIGRAEM